ncbi:MAG: hypothetical protein LBJ73_03325 [Rickettsiales bacterium]|jgi:hypothetical protein|nr:hypothetical protein [Rickettsiales bacterium]
MKKSTITALTALLVCAFVFQGAFADVISTGSDSIGSYEISIDTENNTPNFDYNRGIHTIQNTNGKYSTNGLFDEYKGETVRSYSYDTPSDLNDYYLQDVCASSGVAKCYDIGIDSNNTAASNDINNVYVFCYCRLKRKIGDLSPAGWVILYSLYTAANCAQNCAYDCMFNAGRDSEFLSTLLAPFLL